jgi:hypothetical protein
MTENYEVANTFYRRRCQLRNIKRANKLERKGDYSNGICTLGRLTHLANAGLCTGFA